MKSSSAPLVLALGLALAHLVVPPGFADGIQTENTHSPETGPMSNLRPELLLGRTEDYDFDPPEPGTYALPVLKAAEDGQVLLPNGKPSSLLELARDRINLVSFIYLRCRSPKACPYATGVLRRIHETSQLDPMLAQNLQLITLSFDPEHDTPERMANYGQWFEPDKPAAPWHFLTTASNQALDPILEAYDQTVDRRPNPTDDAGPLFHPVRVFLIDRQAQIRNVYNFSMLDPRLLITDVRTLLLEEARSATATR